MIAVSKRLEGIGEYYFSRKLAEIAEMNKRGESVINLGIGSPDQPPHPDVIKILQEEAIKPGVHGYQSYKGAESLRVAVAAWYKKWYSVDLDPATEILPLIGSKEGIMHICMTYVDPGTLVLVPNPGYPTYRSAAKLAGAEVVEYTLKEENNWFPDFEELTQLLQAHRSESGSQSVLMFVNYPQMPTGVLPTKELFEELVAFANSNNVLICHDNPYSFILNEHPMSMLGIDGAKDRVLELNSLSKASNMAGWRVGVLCAAKERINEVLIFKSNMDSGMFLPVQLAAAKAVSLGREWYDGINAVYRKRRIKAYELLNLLDCHYSGDQAGMFVWAKVPARFSTGFQLSDEVLKDGRVFITPGGIFGSAGEHYIRVSLCSSEETFDNAIERIKTVLDKWS
ncbi:MAG TPA: aminotransferase class I/II-fold pyridoxal phosphate-dependent enzyme [Chitinophagaceae bacterium]|jgi:aspartate/methionine/tyrosine aminotransferase|nr:aminotransferase class I/II-fold pyridoxal phosphate-dependent enzyme [Chitinophagaceae bacterium]